MPFKWEKKKSPYRSNCYGTLKLGPNAEPKEVRAQAKNITDVLKVGMAVESAARVNLDEYAVNEASRMLNDPRTWAEELLLMHPQPQREGPDKLKKLVEEVRKSASLPEGRPRIPLRSAMGLLWFVPAPGPEAAQLPDWNDLGMVGPLDPEDLALDVVFDV
jgi:hypothetical protein